MNMEDKVYVHQAIVLLGRMIVLHDEVLAQLRPQLETQLPQLQAQARQLDSEVAVVELSCDVHHMVEETTDLRALLSCVADIDWTTRPDLLNRLDFWVSKVQAPAPP